MSRGFSLVEALVTMSIVLVAASYLAWSGVSFFGWREERVTRLIHLAQLWKSGVLLEDDLRAGPAQYREWVAEANDLSWYVDGRRERWLVRGTRLWRNSGREHSAVMDAVAALHTSVVGTGEQLSYVQCELMSDVATLRLYVVPYACLFPCTL